MYCPKVSVIVPVFNTERYIKESIESICQQTYKNIEVIVVDDESSDGAVKIASHILGASLLNYKAIRQKNKGLPGARNTGINASTGEFLCFIDSDDIIAPSHISDLVEIIKNNNLDVAHSMFEFTKEDNRIGIRKKTTASYILDRESF